MMAASHIPGEMGCRYDPGARVGPPIPPPVPPRALWPRVAAPDAGTPTAAAHRAAAALRPGMCVPPPGSAPLSYHDRQPPLTAALVVDDWRSNCTACGGNADPYEPLHHSGGAALRPGLGCGALYTAIASHPHALRPDLVESLRDDLPYVGRWPVAPPRMNGGNPQ